MDPESKPSIGVNELRKEDYERTCEIMQSAFDRISEEGLHPFSSIVAALLGVFSVTYAIAPSSEDAEMLIDHAKAHYAPEQDSEVTT